MRKEQKLIRNKCFQSQDQLRLILYLQFFFLLYVLRQKDGGGRKKKLHGEYMENTFKYKYSFKLVSLETLRMILFPLEMMFYVP